MTDDRWLDDATEVLREPVQFDPSFDERVMAQIRAAPSVHMARPRRGRRRPLLISPIGAVALAAAALAGVLAGRSWLAPQETQMPVAADMVADLAPESAIQFVIVAPEAATVTLVGDFNDWSRTATPLRRAPGDGVWSVTVPLSEGRYRYAFLVDGDRWVTDPSAPRAIDDDFGPPNSVVTVGAS